MKKNDNRDIASDSKVNRCVGWVYDIVRNQSKPNVFLDKYIYPWATAVGNTVLYPNQINPPIQNNSTSNQPHQHSYSRSQPPQTSFRGWTHGHIWVSRRWRGRVRVEDECKTWSGDWDCTCVVGDAAVDDGYVETTAETTVD